MRSVNLRTEFGATSAYSFALTQKYVKIQQVLQMLTELGAEFVKPVVCTKQMVEEATLMEAVCVEQVSHALNFLLSIDRLRCL